MRKLLLSIAVLGGVAALGLPAKAAPAPAFPAVKASSLVRKVQYYDPDWREREEWRRRRAEEWRRREAYREREEWRDRRAYGAPPPVVYGAPPPAVYAIPRY